MANGLPTPKSYQQILGDMLATYMSKIGVNDLYVGSAVTSFFEAMAQAIYRSSGDIFSILRDFSVDRASGEALKRIAADENVTIPDATVASGTVTISDSNFNKISTKLYAGSAPPNIGSNIVYVSDASAFTASGSIYIGRGTNNIEGPIAYSSIVNVGSFWQINLSSSTTKYHNNSESVILAQGGTRNIASGTLVKTVSSGSATDIVFQTTRSAVILDGEDSVSSVPVSAQEPGTDSNVPRYAIQAFVAAPFTGAVVSNPNPFTNGRSDATDEEIQILIKAARISRGLGTALAIKNAVIGAQASDDDTTITSDEIFSDSTQTTLYIDNGQGLEEKTTGVGLEYIVDSALGGEDRFQLATGGSQTSVVKAQLVSTLSSPFAINPNDKLSILVGDILNEHAFADGDFKTNGVATAFEVVASINSDANISFSARTIENGTKVVLSAKSETDEYLQKTTPTSGVDAGVALGLPSDEVQTLRLYKNNQPLTRNGRSAIIESKNQSDWSATIESSDTLIVSVDGTDPITYTITNNDFLKEGSSSIVSKSNSLQSWANVFNAKITGVTASVNGSQLVLESNLGTKSRASLAIDVSSTLVTKGMFDSNQLTASGRDADFTLSRNTAQFKLNTPLSAGDSLTAGSDFTVGYIESAAIVGGNVSFASDAKLWVLIDNPNAVVVNHGVVSNSLITVSKQASNIIRFQSNVTNAFGNLQPGDYVVIWSDELNANNRLEGRVHGTGTITLSNDYFEMKVTGSEWTNAVAEGPLTFNSGLDFIRSDIPPQKILIAAGTYDINTVASDLESQILGSSISTVNDENIILATQNKGTDGSVFLFTLNNDAKNLNFTKGDYSASNFSHYAYLKNPESAQRFPAFVHASMTQDEKADVPSSYISIFNSDADLLSLGVNPNMIACMQNPYLSNGSYIKDAQAYDECVQIDDIDVSGLMVNIDQSKTIRRIRVGDRFYIVNPLDFDYSDYVTVILDSDSANKTFPINVYRKATTNSTMPVSPNQFRAYDTDAGATTEFSQFFGSGFDFKNHKVLMKARNGIDPVTLVDQDAIFYRSAVWGSSGEKYAVGYTYPTAANQDIQHNIEIGSKVKIYLSLKSGAAVANNIDGTTQWNVTVTPNAPSAGMETVSYTWNTVGTNPSMGTLVAGNYVTINTNGGFNIANVGTFKIQSATSTSFTVYKPNGTSVAETGATTLTTNTISLYANSDTTAQNIVDYVTANLSDWLTAEVLNDNGTSGSGVIGTSTYEDNSFAADTDVISLVDGLNWVASSNLGASAPSSQFTFKNALQLDTFSTNTANAYSFNNGEELRIIPTTIKQVINFINILAVTGFQTLGIISNAYRENSLELSTQILGSSGSIKVTGGTANGLVGPIVGVSSLISGTDLLLSGINRYSSNGINGGSWVKLVASNSQKKITGISNNTQVTITPNSPTASTSTVELFNRDVTDRYFGQPRNCTKTRSRAFNVEKQGSLVNISWDGVTGTLPLFSKSVEINDSAGATVSVTYNSDTKSTEIAILSGNINFSEVQIGDSATTTNFADADNNGTFLVNGISDDGLTLSLANENGVNVASVAIASGDISVSAEITEGDAVTLQAPFASLNQGRFRLIRKYSNSFYIDNPDVVEERVVVSDNLRSLGFDATTQFDVTVSGDMQISWNGSGTQPTLSNAKMGDEITVGTSFNASNQGIFMVTESGDNYIKLANAKAVAETGVVVNGVGGNVLEAQIPAISFNQYENTDIGDSFVISGNVLTSANQGDYVVSDILSKTKIVVSSVLTSQTTVQLNDLYPQVYIQEGVPYSGYKHIYTKLVDPANSEKVDLVFDSSAQYEKIVESANIEVSAQSKLDFSESLVAGFDGYKYYVGAIRQANKIVYGDPRDSVTFPGVAAAGAEINVEASLLRRIQVSVNVRVNTGVPFPYISEQVRNNIAALINSGSIGQSIAISDIISTVNSIPGVKAVSISFPQFDASNDVIVISSSEKPFVLDPANDITVSKVG